MNLTVVLLFCILFVQGLITKRLSNTLFDDETIPSFYLFHINHNNFHCIKIQPKYHFFVSSIIRHSLFLFSINFLFFKTNKIKTKNQYPFTINKTKQWQNITQFQSTISFFNTTQSLTSCRCTELAPPYFYFQFWW